MGVSKDEVGKGEKATPFRTRDSTPNSKIDSRGPPCTPCKPKARSKLGETTRRNALGSAVRSLTPLFNGFSAAQQRASQLGGRYGTISRRSLNMKKRRSDTRVRHGTDEEGSKKKKLEVHGGVRKPNRTAVKDDVSQMSIHTAPLAVEPRILEFNAIIKADIEGKETDRR